MPVWKDMNPSRQASVFYPRATWGLPEWPQPTGFESQEITGCRVNQVLLRKIAHIVLIAGNSIYTYSKAALRNNGSSYQPNPHSTKQICLPTVKATNKSFSVDVDEYVISETDWILCVVFISKPWEPQASVPYVWAKEEIMELLEELGSNPIFVT